MYGLLCEQRVTHTAGVPTVWLALMEHMQRTPSARLSDLKLLVVGGAACPRCGKGSLLFADTCAAH